MYKGKTQMEKYINQNLHRWKLITSPGDNRNKMKKGIK
jgi:hypothetical protein